MGVKIGITGKTCRYPKMDDSDQFRISWLEVTVGDLEAQIANLKIEPHTTNNIKQIDKVIREVKSTALQAQRDSSAAMQSVRSLTAKLQTFTSDLKINAAKIDKALSSVDQVLISIDTDEHDLISLTKLVFDNSANIEKQQ